MSRKEGKWPDLFAQFGDTKIVLHLGRVHVLGGVILRAPHVLSPELKTRTLSASETILDLNVGEHYENNQVFRLVLKASKGILPGNAV